MSCQKIKSNGFCVGSRPRSAIIPMDGDVSKTGQKILSTRDWHKDIDVFLGYNIFRSIKKTIGRNSNVLFLFIRVWKEIGNLYRDIVGFDGLYDEFKALCRKAWKEHFCYP